MAEIKVEDVPFSIPGKQRIAWIPEPLSLDEQDVLKEREDAILFSMPHQTGYLFDDSDNAKLRAAVLNQIKKNPSQRYVFVVKYNGKC